MTTQRIDPLGLLRKPGAETAGVPKKEVARMNNTVPGLCPICQAQMPVVQVGNVDAYVCIDHCVCLPTPDA